MSEPTLTARGAAAVLEPKLADFRGGLTVADGAARGGLALRDAEAGLRWLAAERGGHLAATESGELLYSFPDGLVQRREEGWLARAAKATGRVLAGVGRFVVRAWVSIVMVSYAVIFLAVAIAIAARSEDSDVGAVIGVVLRVIAESLYWTFHPFSPVYWSLEPGWARQPKKKGLPFYERVNRFVFGPPPVVEDPRERERRVLGEIRRLSGRVGPGDLMRVTGMEREDAERELLRLLADYEGDVQVSDDGALVYAFKSLRLTSGQSVDAAPAPVWQRRETLPALTGNGAGTNVGLAVLNGFNLTMGAVGVGMGLTIDRIFELITHAREVAVLGAGAPPLGPAEGVPLLLGWIPLAFSTVMFAVPAFRALRRRRERQRVADENGRRALMRLVLAETNPVAELSPDVARRAWAAAAGGDAGKADPTPRIEAAVRALGGEIDLDADGKLVYRFTTVAREHAALAAQRTRASLDEAQPGAIVFSSNER
jgi:hypothetical protein